MKKVEPSNILHTMAYKITAVVASIFILMLLVSHDEVQAGGCHERHIKMSCQDWVKCFEWCRLYGYISGYCDAGTCMCKYCTMQSQGHHSADVPSAHSSTQT
uniref:Uncharacterized protein n=1 Tax=Avena sativa TaxID=4498 RepID=A0ACD5YRL3_AVESA